MPILLSKCGDLNPYRKVSITCYQSHVSEIGGHQPCWKRVIIFFKVPWSLLYDVVSIFKNILNLIGISYQSCFQNVVTVNLTARYLSCFIKVTWSHIDDVIISLQISLNVIDSFYLSYCSNLVTITVVEKNL